MDVSRTMLGIVLTQYALLLRSEDAKVRISMALIVRLRRRALKRRRNDQRPRSGTI